MKILIPRYAFNLTQQIKQIKRMNEKSTHFCNILPINVMTTFFELIYNTLFPGNTLQMWGTVWQKKIPNLKTYQKQFICS
jgi:hypothetical protein